MNVLPSNAYEIQKLMLTIYILYGLLVTPNPSSREGVNVNGNHHHFLLKSHGYNMTVI